jgi:hypothetical protein
MLMGRFTRRQAAEQFAPGLVAAAGTITRGRVMAGSARPVDSATLRLELSPVRRRLFPGYRTEDPPDDANGNGQWYGQDDDSSNKSLQIDPLISLIVAIPGSPAIRSSWKQVNRLGTGRLHMKRRGHIEGPENLSSWMALFR